MLAHVVPLCGSWTPRNTLGSQLGITHLQTCRELLGIWDAARGPLGHVHPSSPPMEVSEFVYVDLSDWRFVTAHNKYSAIIMR